MAEPRRALHLHPVSPDDWESHRDVRLAMLQDAPDAFWFTYADEAVYDEADWRERIEGAWLVQARDADGRPRQRRARLALGARARNHGNALRHVRRPTGARSGGG